MIRPDSRGFVVLLGALTMINALAIDMSLPALPTVGQALHASPDQVQLTLSLFVLGYAGGQFVGGPLCDRFGRRPMLLGGLAIYALAALLCAASRRIDLLVAARAVQGVSAFAGPVVVRAIVRDHFSGARAAQMLSSLTTVFALGPLLAPALGGALLVRFGWPSIFLFLALWAIVLWLVAWRGLPESLHEPDPRALDPSRLVANYRTFLTTRVALGFAVVNGLCWIGIFSFLSGAPFVFIQYYGVAPVHFGFYFALSAVALVAGAQTNRRILRQASSERALAAGFASLIAGSGVVCALPFTPWAGPGLTMAGVMVFMYGQTMVQPNAIARGLEPLRHMAGMGSALFGIIQMVCGSIGGYAVGALYDGTPRPMGALILFAALASSGLYALVLRGRG